MDPVKKIKNILWVEDDAFLGSILMKKIEATGHNITLIKTGNEAIEAIKTAKPDIFILDIFLPGATGFDILQNIRMQERLKDVPVIMLSNTSKQSDVEKAKLLGAQKFLVKAAVSLDEIVREVEFLTNK